MLSLANLREKNDMGINNDRLASWLRHQRWDESRGILPIERVQRLDHILPGWRKEGILDEREQRWQNALVAYMARAKELGRLPTGSLTQSGCVGSEGPLKRTGCMEVVRELSTKRCLGGKSFHAGVEVSKEQTSVRGLTCQPSPNWQGLEQGLCRVTETLAVAEGAHWRKELRQSCIHNYVTNTPVDPPK